MLIRQLIQDSMLALTMFFPFYWVNYRTHYRAGDSHWELCPAALGAQLPCQAQFSHMRADSALYYALAQLAYAVVRIWSTSTNYIQVSGVSFLESFSAEREDFLYSQGLFNAWSWSVNRKVDRQSTLDAQLTMQLTQLREDDLIEALQQRAGRGVRVLYFQRALLSIFNVGFLCGTSFAIIQANMRAKQLEAWLGDLLK